MFESLGSTFNWSVLICTFIGKSTINYADFQLTINSRDFPCKGFLFSFFLPDLTQGALKHKADEYTRSRCVLDGHWSRLFLTRVVCGNFMSKRCSTCGIDLILLHQGLIYK